jgi:macrolide-specific efflux system membrane fusion protein
MGQKLYLLSRLFVLIAKIFVSIILISSITIFSSCNVIPKEEEPLPPPIKEPPKVEYKTVPAKRGTLIKSYNNLTAKFMCPVLTDIAFQDTGLKFKAFTIKEGDTVNAGDVLAEAETSTLESQIAQQEITLRKLELTYSQQKANNSDEFTLMKTSIDLENAIDKLNDLKAGLERAKLISPISGQVTFVDSSIKEGDNITAKKVLIRVADLSQLVLEYTGDKVNELKTGMKVAVTYNHNPYEGEIISTPREVPSDADSNSKKAVLIKVNGLPNPVKALNDSASFSVVLDVRENVIITYRNYLSRTGGKNTLQVLQDGVKVQRTVEVGLETTNEVEIISGLEEGELVIVP